MKSSDRQDVYKRQGPSGFIFKIFFDGVKFKVQVKVQIQAVYDIVEPLFDLVQDPLIDVYKRQEVADIQNSAQGSTMGGGAIVAGLFLQEFVEDHSWVHVDIAPVSWESKDIDYSIKGATGYGVSLLYETVKVISR